ncbi:MAG: sigma-70 family RNA polymerase sigma factor [Proteobacteria bacterium]|nr:sigma-70 family RNA polymerase sigma factor [Pseudomonadota bacterium]
MTRAAAAAAALDIEGLKAGDSGAWREVMSLHGPSLLGYATRMLGSRTTAEEVVQDALVKAYKAIDRFDGRASLKTWMIRIVHNRAIDELRRNKRYVDLPDDDPEASYFDGRGKWAEGFPTPEKHIDAKRRLAQVREAMDGLAHSHREVLLLKEVHGLSTDQICEALEISPGNLRIRIHRARKALRAAVVDPGTEA